MLTTVGLHELAPVIESIPDARLLVHISDQMTAFEPRSKTTADTFKRVANYLEPLIAKARQFLPPNKLKSIPLFLMATGGMRRLKQHHYQEFMVLRGVVIDYIKTCGFSNPQYKTISGEDEGLYGWVAANYNDGKFEGGADSTHGFVEMGGESLQFAVALQNNANSGYTGMLRLVTIGAQEYKVFVKTWLGLGGESAWKRHEEKLRESESAIPHDPCLPKEYSYRLSGSDKIVLGTAKFEQCLKETFSLFDCPDKECLAGNLCIIQSATAAAAGPLRLSPGCLLKDPITGKPFMTLDTAKFNGAAVYRHALHGIFGSGADIDDFATYWGDVGQLSNQSWEEIRADKADTESRFLKSVFFTAAMVMSTLFYGFGIPMPPEAIVATMGIARERAKRALAAAVVVEGAAVKKYKYAEKGRKRAVEQVESASQEETTTRARAIVAELWPTEAHAKACKRLYDARPNEANRLDMIATMGWATAAEDSKVIAAEATRVAIVARAKASALATDAYSVWVKAKSRVRHMKFLVGRLSEQQQQNPVLQPAAAPDADDDNAFQYNSTKDADWPFGRIVLLASGSRIDVRSARGWN